MKLENQVIHRNQPQRSDDTDLDSTDYYFASEGSSEGSKAHLAPVKLMGIWQIKFICEN